MGVPTKGKHAFNMGDRSSLITVRTWPQRLADWLYDSGFLKPDSAANSGSSPSH